MQLHSLESDASQSGCAQAEGLFLWLAWEGGKWLKAWQRKICFFLFCSEQLLFQTRQRILYNYSLFAYTDRPDGRKNKLSPRFRQKLRRCRTSSFLTVWEGNVQTLWVTLWWDEREIHLFPGRRIRAESCGAAGSRTAQSSQGQQMTAANWKTNEVNKSNLDSGVAAVFVRGHRGKAPTSVCGSILCWCSFLIYCTGLRGRSRNVHLCLCSLVW